MLFYDVGSTLHCEWVLLIWAGTNQMKIGAMGYLIQQSNLIKSLITSLEPKLATVPLTI